MPQCPSYMFFSEVFFIVETKDGGIYNIPMILKNQIYADNLHPDDSLLTQRCN